MRFDLLVFDLDGTLVDSEHDLTTAVNLLRAEYREPPLPLEAVRSYIGNGIKTLVERVLPEATVATSPEPLTYFRKYYREHLIDTTVLYPGIRELLERLPQEKAVLTNKSDEFALAILQKLKVADYFSAIVGSTSGLKPKPSPEPLLAIINRLHKTPASTAMIGDGINDILSARAAGVASIGVGFGYTSKETLLSLHPDYFFDTVAELQTLSK